MEDNKKVEEVINDRTKEMFYGFAKMMDAIWGNDDATKELKEFLEQDSSILNNKESDKK